MNRKARLFITIAIGLSLAFSRPALSEELTLLPGEVLPILQNVQVMTSVVLSDSGIYTFAYTITNPESNTGEIWSIGIDITKPTASQDVGSNGIINGPRFARNSSELVLSSIGMPLIPVGLFSPTDWISGLSMNGTAGWGGADDPFRLLPGRTVSGFELTSRGLPGIRSIVLKPKFEQTPVDEATPENTERLRAIDKAIDVTAKTLGPTAPPANFVALDFLNYLIDLKHQAEALGWIGGPKFVTELDKKLDQVKEKLQANNLPSARGKLKSFINKVEAQFKETKEHEVEKVKTPAKGKEGEEKKFITSEGYGLLKFNAQYLRDQLGGEKESEGQEETEKESEK